MALTMSLPGMCQTTLSIPQNDQLEREKFELENRKFFWTAFGACITVTSVIIAAIGLGISWNKDRALKRQQYADQIRRAAGQTIAKLERWSAVSDGLFLGIQPAITDADILLVKSRDVIATRDKLWRALLKNVTARSQSILDEQIELAYVDLYGYDPRVRDLFRVALQRLRQIDEQMDNLILLATQADVLSFEDENTDAICTAALGNRLRATVGRLRIQSRDAMNNTIVPFQTELARLIDATDTAISDKKLRLQDPAQVFRGETGT